MFDISTSGSYKNTENFLTNLLKLDILRILESCGREGVQALEAATPRESGLAAGSWGYETSVGNGSYSISWTNSDVERGFPVAIMLQYGYGTGTGGYVAGRDYINPAMKPIFDKIAERVWKAVMTSG